MNEHKKNMLDVSQSPSKKQIRTSKISVFIISAGQLKNSQHWQGYQRQLTPANSYLDISDLHLIRTCLRPPFREDQGNIIPSFRYYSRPEILDFIPFRSHSFEKGSLILLRRGIRPKMH